MVQIAGIRVGRVSEIELGRRPRRRALHHGPRASSSARTATASIEVLNLLGEKFLNLKPEGAEQLRGGRDDPAAADRLQLRHRRRLHRAVRHHREHQDPPAPAGARHGGRHHEPHAATRPRPTFDGLSRLSVAIASRDQEIQSLLERASSVSRLLAARKGDIVALIKDSDLILQELRKRMEAIHALLVNTASLSARARRAGRRQPGADRPDAREPARGHPDARGPARSSCRAAIHNLGPYTRILSNIIGTGPWFDAYAVELLRHWAAASSAGADAVSRADGRPDSGSRAAWSSPWSLLLVVGRARPAVPAAPRPGP